MKPLMNPQKALLQNHKTTKKLNVCEHYTSNEKGLLKALDLQKQKKGQFDITFDFEDGAQLNEFENQKKIISNLLLSNLNTYNRIGIRLFPYTHPSFYELLRYLISSAGSKIAYFTLPKIHNEFEVKSIAGMINRHCNESNIESIPLHVIIESEHALEKSSAIAQVELVQCLDFGIMDYVSDLNYLAPQNMESPLQFENSTLREAKKKIVHAAHLSGKIAAHNVSIQYKNYEITRNDAHIAFNQLGFRRMWSIHPEQIAAILSGMQYEEVDLLLACEVLIKAYHSDWGPIAHHQKLYDRASYRIYWDRILQAFQHNHPLPLELPQEWFQDM